MRAHLFFLLAALLVAAGSPCQAADDPAALDFFETKIRPVLATHCYECHSADVKDPKGGLALDTRAGIRGGGDSGPAVVPGDVDASLILDALRYESYEMPPKGKLPDPVIADFQRWIEMGAPDPRDGPTVARRETINLESGRQFWSFQAPTLHDPPEVANDAWPAADIDRFILARLEAAELSPTNDASPEAVIRRLYFDLSGLPPEPEQIEAFAQSATRDPQSAIESVIDELLASPHFGERWGRHWLDIARYADSTGGGRTRTFDNSWRYRDYVIRSFNRDKPLGRFVAEQVAGDLLQFDTIEEERDGIIATGYLVLGPTNYENQDKELLRMDVVDEQIDSLGRGVLGLTLGCARCHDHKFDPVPTRDYYALAGIFRSTKVLTPGNVAGFVERPLPLEGEAARDIAKYEQRIKELSSDLQTSQADVKRLQGGTPQPAGGKAVQPAELPGIVLDDADAKLVGEWEKSTYHPTYVGASYLHDGAAGKGDKSATFRPKLPSAGEYEVRVASTPGTNRAPRVPVTIQHAGGEKTVHINQQQTPPIDGLFFSLGTFRFEAGESAAVIVSNADTSGHVIVDGVQFLSPDAASSPTPADKPDSEEIADKQKRKEQLAEAQARVKSLQAELNEVKKQAPPRPMAMAAVDEATVGDWHVHIRGEIRNLGPIEQRGMLQVAASPARPPIESGESGRRELADWLSSTENPLTARVWVNRVWHHLLGAGIVRTVDNFGSMGERPSHPELLDWLAIRFMEEEWSTKRLIREIARSRVYRLASHPQSASANPQSSIRNPQSKDPENRLLGRAHRRRLDAESIRDAMLAVSGQLDLRAGGNAVNPANSTTKDKIEYGYRYTTRRRSVYVPVFRNKLYEFFEVFDFADPNLVIGRRTTTTLPTQALYLMNSPFVIGQSNAAAERLLESPDMTDAERIRLAYRRTLGRDPTEEENALALEHIRGAGEGNTQKNARIEAFSGLMQALFSSVDFRYLE